jgi:hypothetical protein
MNVAKNRDDLVFKISRKHSFRILQFRVRYLIYASSISVYIHVFDSKYLAFYSLLEGALAWVG